MTTKNPVVLTFDSATGPIRLNRGQNVRLETLEGSTFHPQVVPHSVERRIKEWEELTPGEKEAEALTFKPGRSPIFWLQCASPYSHGEILSDGSTESGQVHTYILRAFSQDCAGNRSPIWERRIQCLSPLSWRLCR